tara:strand:+ start:56 stop:328 length:273 start_codon:yes stop_codon:yes gene_type:complete
MDISNKQNSKELNNNTYALKILIQLVNIAQKRGAYDIQESSLAFYAMTKFLEDSKLKNTEELLKKLLNNESLDKNIDISNHNQVNFNQND